MTRLSTRSGFIELIYPSQILSIAELRSILFLVICLLLAVAAAFQGQRFKLAIILVACITILPYLRSGPEIDPKLYKRDTHIALVTGGNAGIGIETVKLLCEAGFHVILGSRSLRNGLQAADSIRQTVPSAAIHVIQLDLSSLDNVAAFARIVLNRYERLDVFIANAGVGDKTCDPFTKDGLNGIVGVNHVAHQYLESLLRPLLMKTEKSRLIFVSSVMAYLGSIHKDWLEVMKRPSFPLAYSTSKLQNIMCARKV